MKPCLELGKPELRSRPRLLDELGRRDLGVGVLGDPRELVPVEAAVEPDAEPAPMPDVRRNEELLGIGARQQLLNTLRCRAPDRKPPVAVVVRQDHQKRPLPSNEEGGRTVAEPLARLGQRETDSADPLEDVLVHDERHSRSVANGIVELVSFGAARIEGLSVPHTASTSPKTANRAIVARAETVSSRTPAASGPSGAIRSEIVLRTDSARPSSRSGVIAIL